MLHVITHSFKYYFFFFTIIKNVFICLFVFISKGNRDERETVDISLAKQDAQVFD